MRRRWLFRRLAAIVTGAAGLTLLGGPAARAATDVLSNIGPASPLGGVGNWLRYPISNYGLDQHFTVISASFTGGVDASGLIPEIAWFFASFIWFLTSLATWAITELFAFSFSLDLVNGSSATGGAGALGPVSQAIHSIYASVFGAPWLVLALSAVAIWAMWRALVQRRYAETAGALAMSLIYIVVAFFFVAEPGQTIGTASKWTNEMSQAFLSISSHGDPSGGEAATVDDGDQLWSLLVERPWSVLEFGGVEHCAVDGTGDSDSDPESAPVRPLSADPGQDSALARRLADGTEVSAERKTCVNNANKYASHFLQFGFGSDERGDEYDALNDGDSSKLPEADKERAGYKLGVPDKPATDAMEEGGQYQRLGLAIVVAIGDLGAIFLLGSLSLLVILSQVLLLLLLAFSPVALVAAAIPGRGHEFFKTWLGKLGGYLLRKAGYSLILAVLLAVNSAIAGATSQLGWLFSFGLQSLFFWCVLIQRRTLLNGIVGIATGPRSVGGDLALDAIGLYAGARLGLAPIRGAGRAVRGAGRLVGGARRRRADYKRRHPYGRFGSHESIDLGLDHGAGRAGAGGGGAGGSTAGGGGSGGRGSGGGPVGGGSGGTEGGRAGGGSSESTAGGSASESVAEPPPRPERDTAGNSDESSGRRRVLANRAQDTPEGGPDASAKGAGKEPPRSGSASPKGRGQENDGKTPEETAPASNGRRRRDGGNAPTGADEDDRQNPSQRRPNKASPRPRPESTGPSATPRQGKGKEATENGSELTDDLRVERERRTSTGARLDREVSADELPPAPRETVASGSAEEPSSPPRRRRRIRLSKRRGRHR